MAEKIQANMVIEILGRPPEHISGALKNLVEKLGTEKGVKILDKNIHEPVPVKDSKDIYTSFADVSLELDSLSNYFGLMFLYMPAHMEIVSPEKIALPNLELNELANRLLARLHDYDAITKKFIYERNFLLKKLREVAPHMFKEQNEPETAEKTSETEGGKESRKKAKSKSD